MVHTGLPTLTLVKLVDGDRKTGNPSEKKGDLYWSIEGAEGARLQVPKALAPRGVWRHAPLQKIFKNWSSNMRFPAFLGMFIAKKMRGSHNIFYVKNLKKHV